MGHLVDFIQSWPMRLITQSNRNTQCYALAYFSSRYTTLTNVNCFSESISVLTSGCTLVIVTNIAELSAITLTILRLFFFYERHLLFVQFYLSFIWFQLSGGRF